MKFISTSAVLLAIGASAVSQVTAAVAIAATTPGAIPASASVTQAVSRAASSGVSSASRHASASSAAASSSFSSVVSSASSVRASASATHASTNGAVGFGRSVGAGLGLGVLGAVVGIAAGGTPLYLRFVCAAVAVIANDDDERISLPLVMVLQVVLSAASALYSSRYFVHIIAGFTAVYVLHAFAQGKRTTRERDLHARTIIITGAFTPIGLTLAQNLAQRGAHLILLTPQPIDSGEPAIFIPLLRSTTSNEEIYAEQCDLSSPSSIRSFCSKFLAGKTNRLDGLIFAHEYQHIGPASLFSTRLEDGERARREREGASLATFLCITLLLPSLLVAPVERDIRIINVVNPFYAAAAAGMAPIDPSPSVAPTSTPTTSLLLAEGLRSLRTCLLARHLQRILDALPAAQVPKTDDAGAGPSAIPVASAKAQKSNIVVVSVSPGISRAGTVMHLLNADWVNPSKSKLGVFCYILLQPILRIFAKSTNSAIQTILHALFLPTPFKTVGIPMLSHLSYDQNDSSHLRPKKHPHHRRTMVRERIQHHKEKAKQ
ncbi:hypothetical protein ONZ45_g19432 [Pleurotus djamor]|nr:hypothetical protein ONZ45_g19432 [Pleurotus djamor]